MTGKQFGKEYIGLTEKEENLEWCVSYLEGLDNQWKTEDAINAIRKELEKTQLRVSEMEGYEIVKRLP